jgi:hypothetical protein
MRFAIDPTSSGGDEQLDLNFQNKIDQILGASIDLRMTFLPFVALYFTGNHTITSLTWRANFTFFKAIWFVHQGGKSGMEARRQVGHLYFKIVRYSAINAG